MEITKYDCILIFLQIRNKMDDSNIYQIHNKNIHDIKGKC